MLHDNILSIEVHTRPYVNFLVSCVLVQRSCAHLDDIITLQNVFIYVTTITISYVEMFAVDILQYS